MRDRDRFAIAAEKSKSGGVAVEGWLELVADDFPVGNTIQAKPSGAIDIVRDTADGSITQGEVGEAGVIAGELVPIVFAEKPRRRRWEGNRRDPENGGLFIRARHVTPAGFTKGDDVAQAVRDATELGFSSVAEQALPTSSLDIRSALRGGIVGST